MYNYNPCEECVNIEQCKNCIHNPIYANMFSFVNSLKDNKTEYIPTCPRDFTDCICDPAYIKFNYPDWYKDLYGDMTPEEASKKHCEKIDANEYCYDDEDK